MASKTIQFFGDICLENIAEGEFAYGPRLVKEMDDVINIGNLETPLTSSREEKDHQAHVLHCIPEKAIGFLKPFKVVSLANNHIQDFFDKGIDDTRSWLDKCGIRYFGVGKNQTEAIQPLCMDFDGLRMAFIGASRYANAAAHRQGTSKESLNILRRLIRSLKKEGWMVVPFFHWGYLYQRLPSPREVRIAHKCIDYGADLVLGSHSHVFQAHERYRGKEIWYGLGNFIFHPEVASVLSDKGDRRVLESFFLRVDVEDGKVISCMPKWYRIENERVEMIPLEMSQRLERELVDCSADLKGGFLHYRKMYYRQAVRIARQSRKMRHEFQMAGRTSWKDRLKIYTDFNFQDVCNRAAALVPWLFK